MALVHNMMRVAHSEGYPEEVFHLPLTAGRESACLIQPWDKKGVLPLLRGAAVALFTEFYAIRVHEKSPFYFLFFTLGSSK